jgi:hypothetical protein
MLNAIAIIVVILPCLTLSLATDVKPIPRGLGDTFAATGSVRIDLGDKNITGNCTALLGEFVYL